jgi:hypothetical protein
LGTQDKNVAKNTTQKTENKCKSCINKISKLIQISENMPSVHKCIVFQIIKFDSKTEYVESTQFPCNIAIQT